VVPELMNGKPFILEMVSLQGTMAGERGSM
jgi:hypothetical protein